MKTENSTVIKILLKKGSKKVCKLRNTYTLFAIIVPSAKNNNKSDTQKLRCGTSVKVYRFFMAPQVGLLKLRSKLRHTVIKQIDDAIFRVI